MDVVYLHINDHENDSEELRYSLRSLSNIPHGKVYIVGEKPDWATNIEYIPVVQNRTKGENVMMNIYAAVKSERVSNNFIMMNDDFFIMKKIQQIPSLNFGKMEDIISQYKERYPEGSSYIDSMKKLYEILTETGYENPISYELHVPVVINKKNVMQLRQEIVGSFYQFRTYYGNHFHMGGKTVGDVKIFFDPRQNNPSYNNNPARYLSKQTLLSATGGSFKKGLVGDFVKSAFPKKSIYEA